MNRIQAQMPCYAQYNNISNAPKYQNNSFNAKSLQALNCDTVSFTSEANTNKPPRKRVKVYTCEATTGKKWGVGIASAFIPGLGQAINGDWTKAAAFFVGAIASSFLLGPIGTTAIGVWSIVDAVKNAKSEIRTLE